MTIPGIRRARTPLWHFAVCLVAVAFSFVGLAWVFTGGPDRALADESEPATQSPPALTSQSLPSATNAP